MNEPEPIVLRSTSNPTVRRLVRMRDNRARRRAGKILVDGWRETAQALSAGLNLCGVYLPESHSPAEPADSTAAEVRQMLRNSRAHQHWVSDAVMQKISYGQSSRGVVAEFDQPEQVLGQLDLPPRPLLLVLDRIEKPGNVGAVFRCADAAGVDAVLLCDCRGDVFNPNAIRNSLGAVFRMPSATASQAEIAEFLVAHRVRAVAARVEASTPLWTSPLQTPLAIILGNEAEGLGDRWTELGNQPIAGIRIPMYGDVDSLNLSVSAAVLAFEAARQNWHTGADPKPNVSQRETL
ncbi:MAG: RNA methyltransferase [Pirellulales bacterium]|nr:RNA methyltransferase [Pirellulales bacterium]